MKESSTHGESLKSRVLFLIAGIALGVGLSETGATGGWVIAVVVLSLIAFGEVYLYFTKSKDERS